tara:strand:- start:102 stop:710 length:609 start_codon:yes stop_codon:yes gene_type:complete
LLKKILTIIVLLCFVSCPGHHNAKNFFSNQKKRIYKSSFCDDKKKFPQMVIIPFFENATQIVPNCNTYPKHKTALALMVFYHHWVKWFGDEDLVVKKSLEKLMIEWSDKKKQIKRGYSLKGEKRENVTVLGITKTNSYIWVWKGYFHKISESSLMHELVHIALRAKYGHGDSDHEGDKYAGWTVNHSAMILEAKEVLRSFDI